jgi:hypothetical protein
MEDAAFTRDRLKTLLPRLETRYRETSKPRPSLPGAPRLTSLSLAVLRCWMGSRSSIQKWPSASPTIWTRCVLSTSRSTTSIAVGPMACPHSAAAHRHWRRTCASPLPTKRVSCGGRRRSRTLRCNTSPLCRRTRSSRAKRRRGFILKSATAACWRTTDARLPRPSSASAERERREAAEIAKIKEADHMGRAAG